MYELIRITLVCIVFAPAFLISFVFSRKISAIILRNWIVKLGPVYIKFAQVLSTRGDVLSDIFRLELAKLRSDVPAEPDRIIKSLLKSELPYRLSDIFTDFSEKPIAAGTVAQVHQAYLKNGDKVAVKILRPGIAKKITRNFSVLEAVTFVLSKLSHNIRAANISGIIKELKILLLSQTDLRDEKKNYLEFSEVFKDEKGVTVPGLHLQYCGENILVMEFIDAIEPEDFEKLNIEPRKLASRLDSMLDNMLFIHGLLHADLHPGNFFWDKQGRIVLIDLGLVHRLSRLDRNHIMTFYFSIVDGYYQFAAKYFVTYMVQSCDNDNLSDTERAAIFEAASNDAFNVIEEQYVSSGGQPKVNQIFEQLLGILSRRSLQLRAGYTNIFLTLTTVEGYIFTLDPTFDVIENARQKRVADMEYTTVPHEAVQLVVGEYGSYSTACFRKTNELDNAYKDRMQLVLDEMLQTRPGNFLIDVGCGRGALLDNARDRGLNSLGITISPFERNHCVEQGLQAVHCSWENFESQFGDAYPKADYVTVVEMLSHLGSAHENKTGLVALRLKDFFSWLHHRVNTGGRVLLQEMMVSHDFLHSSEFSQAYTELTEELPWSGFTVLEDVIEAASPYFDIEVQYDHSSDIHKTYQSFLQRFDKNTDKIKSYVRERVVEVLRDEISSYYKFSSQGHISLQRMVFTHR